MKALRFVAFLLFPALLRAQGVQVPVPPVTPPPMTINVKVTGAPAGCVQGAPSYSGNTITAPLSGGPCGGTPPPPTCNSQFTIKPTGGVDNSTWLSVIASAKGAPIEICKGTYNLQPISISGANLGCDDEVTVNDTAGYGTYQRMVNLGSNVTIAAIGPNKSCGFTMPFSYASNVGNSNQDTNQYKHCIFPDGNAVNVVLADFWTTKCGGDGISVNNANVTITNVTSSGNIRNGLSFTGAGTSTVNGGIFKGNINFSKAGIADGIDAEMNAPGTVQHLTFNNVSTSGNGMDGVCLCIGQLWTNPSNPSTYVFNNHTSSGNGAVPPPPGLHGGAPYRFAGFASNWQGSIKVNNSTANGQPFTYSYPPQGPINPN